MFPEFLWDTIRLLNIDQINELAQWYYDITDGREEFDNWLVSEGYIFDEDACRYSKPS